MSEMIHHGFSGHSKGLEGQCRFCLESQLSQVQGELDSVIQLLAKERDKFGMKEAILMKEVQRLRAALEITANNIGLIQDGSSQQRWAKIVDQALSSNEGEG